MSERKTFTCPECGTFDELYDDYYIRVILKSQDGFIVKDVCQKCYEKYKEDPNFVNSMSGYLNERGYSYFDEDDSDYSCEILEETIHRVSAGTKHLGSKITIVDPCYGLTSDNAFKVEVAEGNYECVVWTKDEKSKVTYNGETHMEAYKDYLQVVGIYLNGNIPAVDKMTEIACVGVDSGTLGIFSMADSAHKSVQICDTIFTDMDDGGHAVFGYIENGQIVALEIYRFSDSKRD